MGQMIDFARPDGKSSQGWFAEAGPGRPGVVLIQEWWGLSGQIRATAERFAAAGFNVLAPDLYRGRLAASADEAAHLMAGLDFADATFQDLRGAAAWLVQRSGRLGQESKRLGVSGFCMGGALTVAAAVHLPEFAAAVCFYGIPPQDFADPARIKIPFQGHFAQRDDWCTPALVDTLEARLRAAGATAEIHRYAAAHAFFNAERPEVYDAGCAEAAWARSLDFLTRHLGQ